MKAITISQPFASLIAAGEKWVENRVWATDYRGELAIHAGKGTQYLPRDRLTRYPTGCVIAVADLVECLSLRIVRLDGRSRLLARLGISVAEFLDHEHTEGPWCWVLKNVRRLDPPILARGSQGLWECSAMDAENLP